MGGYEIDGPHGPPSLLERYLFAAAPVDEPRVCCLATASGDSPVMLARFYEICEVLPCEPRHLALFQDRDVDDIDEFLFDVDVVYVLGRSEEHTSELQSRRDLVCRLLLE